MTEASEIRFERLYRRYYGALLTYVTRRGFEHEAHDLVADTFLVLWRRLDVAPTDDEAVLLWLYGVIRRVVSTRHRSQRRWDLVESRLATRKTVSALLKLTEDEREVLLLSAWEELSTSEISRVFACSENAASIRLHRARKRFKEKYAKENDEAGHTFDGRPRLRRPPPRRLKGDQHCGSV